MSKKDIMTDPLLRKGHGHQTKKEAYEPTMCPLCKGWGWLVDPSISDDEDSILGQVCCDRCAGTGEGL